jgi:hypothetical protein
MFLRLFGTPFRDGYGVFTLVILLSLSRAAAGDAVHAGFAFDRHELTLETGTRTEAVGPFFYHTQMELGSTWAVPPLFSFTSWLEGDGAEFDLLYPLLTYDRYGEEYRWQFLQLLSFAGGRDQDTSRRRRFTLYPLYFQQRSTDAAENYTALFPVYGHLQNRFGRAEMDFVLWPLYLKTVRRPHASSLPDDPFLNLGLRFLSSRRGDVTTYNYLYPFFHLRYGDGLQGWQVWPLLGHEQKTVTAKTNNWGDPEIIPGHDKWFALWPFFYHQQRGIGSANPDHDWAIVPFYRAQRSPQRDSTSYGIPLGVTITDDRARKYREVSAPWPFIVFARGEGKTINRVWPLFGQGETAGLESDFYLWPVYQYRRKRGETLDRQRTRILLFLASHTKETNKETAKSQTRTDVWPLYTQRRDFDGRSRLQIFAPLEPFLPASKSIERNYSPLWSVWRAEKNPVTGATSQSLLWNLYRRETTPTTRKGSLLFGLIQYHSGAEATRWRLFYLPPAPAQ